MLAGAQRAWDAHQANGVAASGYARGVAQAACEAGYKYRDKEYPQLVAAGVIVAQSRIDHPCGNGSYRSFPKVFLVHRNMPNEPQWHDRWEFPGGKVEIGEHPRDTVEREIFEELGWRVVAGQQLGHAVVSDRAVVLAYKCQFAEEYGPEPEPKQFDQWQDGYQWIDAVTNNVAKFQAGTLEWLRALGIEC